MVIFLPFGKSEVFCQNSVGCIFDVFVGRKVISTSYSSATLKVSLFPFKINLKMMEHKPACNSQQNNSLIPKINKEFE